MQSRSERRTVRGQTTVETQHAGAPPAFTRGQQGAIGEPECDVLVARVDLPGDLEQLGIDSEELDPGDHESVPEASLLFDACAGAQQAYRLEEYGDGYAEMTSLRACPSFK